MKFKFCVCALTALAMLTGCSADNSVATRPAPKISVTESWQIGQASTGSSKYWSRLDYPTFSSLPTDSYDVKQVNKDLNWIVSDLVSEFEATVKDGYDGPKTRDFGKSYFVLTAERTFISEKLVSFRFDLNVYIAGTGSEHESVSTNNFDMTTNYDADLNKQLLPEGEVALRALISKKVSQLRPSTDLYEPSRVAVYLNSAAALTLWYVDTAGLHIVFNEGIIGPVLAGGPHEIVLSWPSLSKIINPKSVFGVVFAREIAAH